MLFPRTTLQTGGLLKMVRSATVAFYDAECARRGWEDARQLKEWMSFRLRYKAAKKAVDPKKGRYACSAAADLDRPCPCSLFTSQLCGFAPTSLHNRLWRIGICRAASAPPTLCTPCPAACRPKGDPQDNTHAAALTKGEVLAYSAHQLRIGTLAATRDR